MVSERVSKRVAELGARNARSPYYIAVRDLLADGRHRIDSIVCYGLGPITTSVISQHQLALLLFLRESLGAKLWCYDPVFDADDRRVLEIHSIEPCVFPLAANAFYKDGEGTLLYMPHCEEPVYREALSTVPNAGTVVLFGNRLLNYRDPFYREMGEIETVRLPNERYMREDVFNDCYLQRFPEPQE